MGSGKTEHDAFVALLDKVYKDNIFGCDSVEEDEVNDSDITPGREHMWFLPGLIALVHYGPCDQNKRAGRDMEFSKCMSDPPKIKNEIGTSSS